MCEWIRCEDDLPNNGQMCLVFIPAFGDFKGTITKGEYSSRNGAFWMGQNWWSIKNDVTHWAVPEPPKEADVDQTTE